VRSGKEKPSAALQATTGSKKDVTVEKIYYFDPKRESVERMLPDWRIANGRTLEKVIRLDRKWFAQNPDRSYRARPFDTRETPAGALGALLHGHTRWTLVYQVEPGFRWRAFLSLPLGASPADCDESIRVLFEKCGPNAGYHDFPIKHFRPTGKTWPNTGAGYTQ
jgi:hypothetical protein